MVKKTDKGKDFRSNSFVVSGEYLERLAAGDMKIEEIVNPENIALFTWSGADIMGMLKEDSDFLFGRNTPLPEDVDVESLINDVADALGHVDEIGEILRITVCEELTLLETQQSEKEKDSD